ncbi:hypothetical protein D3C79_814030 [compost metagenome]
MGMFFVMLLTFAFVRRMSGRFLSLMILPMLRFCRFVTFFLHKPMRTRKGISYFQSQGLGDISANDCFTGMGIHDTFLQLAVPVPGKEITGIHSDDREPLEIITRCHSKSLIYRLILLRLIQNGKRNISGWCTDMVKGI